MGSNSEMHQSLSPWILGAGIATLGFMGAALLSYQQIQGTAQLEQARLIQAGDGLTHALEGRIQTYAEIAFGLRGLFIVNPELRRSEFVAAVSQLGVESRYPGVKNIAFTRYITADNKNAFEAQVRADTSVEPKGYPDFSIRPPGDRAEYFVADYLWPQSGSRGIHGLDISAQPANLASMRYSKSSGEPVASGPFDLLQETSNRTGFVIRVPVFKGKDFLGSVALTIRVFDLFQNMEREGHLQHLSLTLSDAGTSLGAKNPSAPTVPGLLMYSNASESSSTNAQRYSRSVRLYGRDWHLDFRPAQTFLTDSERLAPVWTGLSASLMALLLGALVTSLAMGRRHALEREAASGEALQDSEGRWKFAIDGSGDGLWDWSLGTNTVFFSPRWKAMLGFTEAEIGDQRLEWSQRIHPDDQDQVHAKVQAHLMGTLPFYTHTYRMRCKDSSWKWVLDRGLVVHRDAAGQPMRMIGTHSDITANKTMEAELRAERDLSAAFLNHAAALVVVLDREGRILRFNREAERVSGFLFEEVQGKCPWDTVLPPEIAQTVREIAFDALLNDPTRLTGSHTNEWLHRDGGRKLIEWTNSVLVDPNSSVNYVVSIGLDVTERNKIQVALELSIREKSALLKEIHHRVKNNLQVIASLLRMEARRSVATETRQVLTDMQARIRSMALLHEMLYRSGTLASVELGAYLSELAKQVFQTQQLTPGLLQLKLDLDRIAVNMDQAMPLGLLLTELVANCVKHAFPDNRPGEVSVTLHPLGVDARWSLEVMDTGIGLPPDFETVRGQSLGLQLVDDLCSQLDGELEIATQPDAVTRFTVLFQPAEPSPIALPATKTQVLT